MAYADAAFVSQNVYLFCASEGLATGVRASVDRPALAKALKLETASSSSSPNRWASRRSSEPASLEQAPPS